jgi:hypothetical protein
MTERSGKRCGKFPGSVLWLQQGAPATAANLRYEAAARGIVAERLESAYRTIWERQQRGEPPASFAVAATA